jgi:hypothetical protein
VVSERRILRRNFSKKRRKFGKKKEKEEFSRILRYKNEFGKNFSRRQYNWDQDRKIILELLFDYVARSFSEFMTNTNKKQISTTNNYLFGRAMCMHIFTVSRFQ